MSSLCLTVGRKPIAQASHDAVIATEGYANTTDTFFKWFTQLQDKQVPWGRDNVHEQ
jgi:hypothetical protein